jgi:outer membrane protein, heavy metal efflux system
MAGRTERIGSRRLVWLLAASVILIELTTSARAQFNVGAPVGASGGSVVVGNPLGQANFPDWSTPSIAPFSGRGGRGGSHAPASALQTPGAPVFALVGAQLAISPVQPMQPTQYGDLELEAADVYGTPAGMNLDTAIDQLMRQNLDLQAARMEVPMADADVLTANLRANPIFYADSELIPYGHFSFLRPGGPTQYDINISYPLDLTFKRLARTQSAREARNVTEAQLQDAIRTQIDNLYTVYVDDVAAGVTLQFSEKYLIGIRKLESALESLYKNKQVQESDLMAVRAQVQMAELQVKESKQTKIKANRALGLMLSLPLTDYAQIEKLDVFDPFGKLRPLPMSRDELIQKALAKRPDFIAYKYGLERAQADVKLAKANAYPDVYVLYEPYCFQNLTYLGVPSAYSWWLGITATMPVYNRNQGNIARARINVTQSQVQLQSAERVVINDVLMAVQELEQSLVAVVQFREQIIPTSKIVRDAAYRRFTGGQTSALEYLDAQQDYNDKVRSYRDAMVRHRRAILDLNTAVGERVLP